MLRVKWAAQIQSCINPTAHTKKGAAQTEPPPHGCYIQNAVVTFAVVANLKGWAEQQK